MTRRKAIKRVLDILLGLTVVGLALSLSTETVVSVLVVACLPAVNLYPLIYAFRPWRSTPQGRALMIKALGNVVLIDMSFAYIWFGDYPGRDAVRVVGFLLFAVGINYLFWTLMSSPGARDYPPFARPKRRTER
jgi:hypothetical protein